MVTKTAVLNKLNTMLARTPKDSVKYYTIGALYILVSKDIITVADIEARFPELA